jgi:hypothetical protein
MRREFISFLERARHDEHREIVSLCPLNRGVSAVYYDEEDGSLYRSPQLALAVYDTVQTDRKNAEETDRTKGGIGFIDSIEAGEEFADDGYGGFLGYEYDGKEGDWSGAIEAYKMKRELDRRAAIIRSIPRNLKDKTTAHLLYEAQGRIDDGVLTIRSRHELILDKLSEGDKLETIRGTAEAIAGRLLTIKLEVDKRDAAR